MDSKIFTPEVINTLIGVAVGVLGSGAFTFTTLLLTNRHQIAMLQKQQEYEHKKEILAEERKKIDRLKELISHISNKLSGRRAVEGYEKILNRELNEIDSLTVLGDDYSVIGRYIFRFTRHARLMLTTMLQKNPSDFITENSSFD
jgi:hypothetical protein